MPLSSLSSFSTPVYPGHDLYSSSITEDQITTLHHISKQLNGSSSELPLKIDLSRSEEEDFYVNIPLPTIETSHDSSRIHTKNRFHNVNVHKGHIACIHYFNQLLQYAKKIADISLQILCNVSFLTKTPTLLNPVSFDGHNNSNSVIDYNFARCISGVSTEITAINNLETDSKRYKTKIRISLLALSLLALVAYAFSIKSLIIISVSVSVILFVSALVQHALKTHLRREGLEKIAQMTISTEVMINNFSKSPSRSNN